MPSHTLTASPMRPAYTSEAVKTMWNGGHPFVVNGFGHYAGQFLNIHDTPQLKADGYTSIRLRLSHNPPKPQGKAQQVRRPNFCTVVLK